MITRGLRDHGWSPEGWGVGPFGAWKRRLGIGSGEVPREKEKAS
jgi:hypothetical protein